MIIETVMEKYTFVNGDIYEGEWLNDNRNG